MVAKPEELGEGVDMGIPKDILKDDLHTVSKVVGVEHLHHGGLHMQIYHQLLVKAVLDFLFKESTEGNCVHLGSINTLTIPEIKTLEPVRSNSWRDVVLVDLPGVVHPAGGEQDQPLASLLIDPVILVWLGLEHNPDILSVHVGVGGSSIPPHQYVGKPSIEVGSELAPRHTTVQAINAELNLLLSLDVLFEVSIQGLVEELSEDATLYLGMDVVILLVLPNPLWGLSVQVEPFH